MNYWKLLEKADTEKNHPAVWKMPGKTTEGNILFYNGAALQIGKETSKLTKEKVLLIIGRRVLEASGEVIMESLKKAGIEYDVFSDISAEPDLDTAKKVASVMDSYQYGAVIGVGGGSTLDIAKLAAHGGDGKLIERILTNNFSKPRVPVLLLPTTSGTGSEVSPYIVLTVNGVKKFFTSSEFLPVTAIVDPLLTVSMNARTTAATAFDAMTHGIEGYMACATPYTECLAVESTVVIMKYLERAVETAEDIEARYWLAYGSVLGMMSYVMGGGLFAHSVSYMLTLEKGQPHGVGCGLALPYTMAMNYPHILPFLDRLGAREGGRPEKDGKELIRKIQAVYMKMGLPKNLKELGYKLSEAPEFAEKLLRDYPRPRNPRKVTNQEAVKLFCAMLSGEIDFF